MSPRRQHRDREGVVATIRIAAAAGLCALAVPLLGPDAVQAASQTGETVLIVTGQAGDRPSAATGTRSRRLIMAILARRGHDVRDGISTSSVPGALLLRVVTERRILQGSYVTKAAIGLRATLVDGDTKRVLARFDHGPETKWRLAAHCLQACIDHEVERRIRPLARRLAADVDRRLVQLGRTRHAAATRRTTVSVAFRHVDRTLLPRIEQYLRNFPGVTRVRRDHTARQGILYRLSHDGTARGTDISLRKMLHHLQLQARIAGTGNSYVVEADPAAQPAAHSQDW